MVNVFVALIVCVITSTTMIAIDKALLRRRMRRKMPLLERLQMMMAEISEHNLREPQDKTNPAADKEDLGEVPLETKILLTLCSRQIAMSETTLNLLKRTSNPEQQQELSKDLDRSMTLHKVLRAMLWYSAQEHCDAWAKNPLAIRKGWKLWHMKEKPDDGIHVMFIGGSPSPPKPPTPPSHLN